jgi:hypothetical protein
LRSSLCLSLSFSRFVPKTTLSQPLGDDSIDLGRKSEAEMRRRHLDVLDALVRRIDAGTPGNDPVGT